MGDDLKKESFEPDSLETEEFAANDLEEIDSSENLSDLMDDVEFVPETETIPEQPESGSAYDDMYDYITSHNYGQEDYETYSKDPEWQELNNALLEEQGKEPIDYSAMEESEQPESGSAYDDMYDYITSHNYGQEDYETYSKDPEWQELNNALLEEQGKEPIDYSAMESEPDVQAVDETATMEDPELTEVSEDGEQEDDDEGISAWMDDENLAGDEITDTTEDIPDTEEDIPDTIEDIPDTEEDLSDTEEDLSDTEEAIPDTEEDISDTMEDIQNEEAEATEDVLDREVPGETEAEVPIEAESETVEADATEISEEIIYDIDHNEEFQAALLDTYPEFNDMFENGTFYQQGLNEYGFEGTCGETTQANTLNAVLGTNKFTENDVLSVAIENNLCVMDDLDPANCGGTSTSEFMQLYEEMNQRTGDQLDVELFEYDNALSLDEMAASLEEGSTLNIAVDASELWGMPRDITDGEHYTDHWISVTGVDRDLDGNITGFQIIDSGGGESYLEKDHFERCYLGSEGDRVKDPTCIVVSKKGK